MKKLYKKLLKKGVINSNVKLKHLHAYANKLEDHIIRNLKFSQVNLSSRINCFFQRDAL